MQPTMPLILNPGKTSSPTTPPSTPHIGPIYERSFRTHCHEHVVSPSFPINPTGSRTTSHTPRRRPVVLSRTLSLTAVVAGLIRCLHLQHPGVALQAVEVFRLSSPPHALTVGHNQPAGAGLRHLRSCHTHVVAVMLRCPRMHRVSPQVHPMRPPKTPKSSQTGSLNLHAADLGVRA